MSFGFARGVPRNADLVFDMRFLDNPHWQNHLRPKTGLEPEVAEFITGDPAYGEALDRIGGLVEFLMPRYAADGKAYVTEIGRASCRERVGQSGKIEAVAGLLKHKTRECGEGRL